MMGDTSHLSCQFLLLLHLQMNEDLIKFPGQQPCTSRLPRAWDHVETEVNPGSDLLWGSPVGTTTVDVSG